MNTLMAASPRKPGPFAVIKTILWSFFGVRRRSGHEQDVQLSAKQVIIAGLIAGVLFVLTLILVVRLVLHFTA